MLLPALECTQCGFVYSDVPPERLGADLDDIAARFASLLSDNAEHVIRARPAEDVWSALEYACHVRDVLWNIRDRIFLAVIEDRPVFAPIHRDERVFIARYNDEAAGVVSQAITLGAQHLGWLIQGLDSKQLERMGVYAGEDRDVLWIGRQALHEARHHFADASAGAAAAVQL